MITLFGDCGDRLIDDLDRKVTSGVTVDMEERFCSVTLDIIGKAVFNYDFGSVTKESPIVKEGGTGGGQHSKIRCIKGERRR